MKDLTEVYHGTRVSKDLILSQGLRSPTREERLKVIYNMMNTLGVDYYKWFKKAKQFLSDPMKYETRSICVTEDYTTAWSYAYRAPEYLEDAVLYSVLAMYPRVGNRRFSELVFNYNNIVREGTKPIVVVLNAKHELIKAEKGGIAIGLSEYVPIETILRIDEYPDTNLLSIERADFLKLPLKELTVQSK